jgi:type II restriction enzyme
LKGLYDLDKGEILVGEEFWNFVAGDNIYEELLDVFQEVGEKLRNEIDKKFAEFRKTKFL